MKTNKLECSKHNPPILLSIQTDPTHQNKTRKTTNLDFKGRKEKLPNGLK